MSNVNPFDKLRVDAERSRSIKTSCKAGPCSAGQMSKLGGLPRRLAPAQISNFWRVRAIRGQSLFEVIFALAVASLVMVGIVSLAASSVRNSTFARNSTLATRYTQETSEWLREQRDTDWNAFKQKAETSATWCLRELSWSLPSESNSCAPDDYVGTSIFVRNVYFSCFESNISPPPEFLPVICSDTDVNYVEVIITVEWSDAQGLHESRTVAQFTRWQTP